MTKAIHILHTIWQEMQKIVKARLAQTSLDKPVVFALYSKERDHSEVIAYREIPTVKVIGDYPNGEYRYTYPGIKKLGFYPPKGAGRWFSGTLVVGDGVELEEGDKNWMIREQLDFRIKMDIDPIGNWSYKTYCIDFPSVSLDLF